MAVQKKIEIKNRRARFDYEISQTWTAGIELRGTEIKSLRGGKASLVDCYCYESGSELFVRGMNISEYSFGNLFNHLPKRDRKLLLNRRELNTIFRAMQDKGNTVVGLKLFINDQGLAKLLIGLGRGRKSYDKREYIKEQDSKRELDRVRRSY